MLSNYKAVVNKQKILLVCVECYLGAVNSFYALGD